MLTNSPHRRLCRCNAGCAAFSHMAGADPAALREVAVVSPAAFAAVLDHCYGASLKDSDGEHPSTLPLAVASELVAADAHAFFGLTSDELLVRCGATLRAGGGGSAGGPGAGQGGAEGDVQRAARAYPRCAVL